MKAFVIVSGTLLGLLVVAHVVRLRSEPQLARDPYFLAATVVAAGLGFWTWRLVWQSRRR